MDSAERDVVSGIAGWVKRSRLETPFVFMLESHRPLLRVVGHGLNIFEPVAAGLMGLERVEKLRRVLFDPAAVEMLLKQLKAGDAGDEWSSDY